MEINKQLRIKPTMLKVSCLSRFLTARPYGRTGGLLLGAHGSPAIFLGFFIPNIGNLIMSIVMLKGEVFSKINSWLGIIGSILMLMYVILVNFGIGVENMATAFAMPWWAFTNGLDDHVYNKVIQTQSC